MSPGATGTSSGYGVPRSAPLQVEEQLERTTPPEFRRNAHHWLLLHGRYTCLARKPGCPECLIADLCEFPDKTPALEAAQGKPAATSARTETRAHVVTRPRAVTKAGAATPRARKGAARRSTPRTKG